MPLLEPRRRCCMTGLFLAWLLRASHNHNDCAAMASRIGHGTAGAANDKSMIYCRLLQAESFLLSAAQDDDASSLTTTTDVSYSSFVCQTESSTVYSVEFQSDADALLARGRFSRPVWISLPLDWLIHDDVHDDEDDESTDRVLVVPPGQWRRTAQPQRALASSGRRRRPRRRTFQNDVAQSDEKEDVAPADFTRMGRKTLLAVRIVTNTEAPDVGADEMEAALFGTAPHPHAANVGEEEGQDENNTGGETAQQAVDYPVGYISVAEQYEAVSLGSLVYEPLSGPGYERGVLEINLGQHLDEDFVIEGEGIQGLAPTLLQITAQTLGVTELTDAVDHVIYCLVRVNLGITTVVCALCLSHDFLLFRAFVKPNNSMLAGESRVSLRVCVVFPRLSFSLKRFASVCCCRA